MKQSWICILLLQYIIHYYYRTGVWSKAGFVYCSFYILSIITVELEYGAKMNLYNVPSIIHYYYRTGVWSKAGFVCRSFYNPLLLQNWIMELSWIFILLLL